MPNRYQLDSNGDWRCPPGEDFAKNFGLYYQVRSDEEINWKKQRNIYFLEDYLSVKLEVPTQDIVEIIKLISINPGIKLSELIERGSNPDYIYKLIADQTVYVDLESFSLRSESERIGVFINRETALALTAKNHQSLSPRKFLELDQVGASGVWDGQVWQVINVGVRTISLLSESAQTIQLPNHEFNKLIEQDKFKALCNTTQISSDIYSFLKQASVDDCIEASRRYSIICPYLQGEKADFTEMSERTFYRWVGNWRQAEEQYGYGYLGLLPKQKKKEGEHQGKLSSQTQKIIDEFIETDYLNLK